MSGPHRDFVGTLRRAAEAEAVAARREALERAMALLGCRTPSLVPTGLVIDWQIKARAQMIQQRIKLLGVVRTVIQRGEAAKRLRDANRRLRAAGKARAHGNDVGQEKVLNGRQGHVVIDEFFAAHGFAPAGFDACEAEAAARDSHCLSGVFK